VNGLGGSYETKTSVLCKPQDYRACDGGGEENRTPQSTSLPAEPRERKGNRSTQELWRHCLTPPKASQIIAEDTGKELSRSE
jgi:hypothetical protein